MQKVGENCNFVIKNTVSKNLSNLQIFRHEGLLGLYKGILPQILSIAPATAIQYGCYSTLTEIYYHMKQDQLNVFEKFLCGSLSGMFLVSFYCFHDLFI